MGAQGSLPRNVEENYHGCSITGLLDEISRQPSISYNFFVYESGDQKFKVTSFIFFPHTIAIENQGWNLDWKKELIEVGLSIVKGRIDLNLFKESEEYVVRISPKYERNNPRFEVDQISPEKCIEATIPSDEDIKEKILIALSNIRQRTGIKYKGKPLDVKGFCLVLGISKDAYYLNAEELIEQGKVSPRSRRKDLEIVRGAIYITQKGLDALKTEKEVSSENLNGSFYRNGDASLAMSKSKAKKLLEKQIEKGRDIKNLHIENDREFDIVREKRSNWIDYCDKLLKRIFLTSEEADRFTGRNLPASADSEYFELPLSVQVNGFRLETERYVIKLEGYVEQLDLYNEPEGDIAPSLAQQSPSERNSWDDLQDRDYRLFGVLKIDVVGHSLITKQNALPKVRDTFDAFREYVEGISSMHNGCIWNWQGDGGLIAFYENPDTIADEAVKCGVRIIQELEMFNREKSQIEDEIKVRIAVHLGTFEYREDKGNLHNDIINFVSHLETEKEKTLPNTISASDNLVSSLIENKKLFIENGEFEGKRVYSTQPQSLLIQQVGKDEVYLLQGKVARHIPDPITFRLLGYSFIDIRELPIEGFAAYTIGKPLDSFRDAKYVRAPNRPEVWALIGNERRHVPDPETLEELQRRWEFQVEDISEVELGKLDKKSPLKSSSEWE